MTVLATLSLATWPEDAQPPAPVVAGPPAGPAEAGDVTSAALTAKTTGRRVEVTDARTATSTSWVAADGTRTTDIYSVPVRYKRNDAWVDIDTELVARADGTVAPKSHPGQLHLAGRSQGRRNDLVTILAKGHRVGLGWHSALPAPDLAGSRATYRNVRSGIDLVVQATRTGFEQYFVLNQRAAVPVDGTLRLALRAPQAKVAKKGRGVDLLSRDGAVLAHIPPLSMWDSGTPRRLAEVQPRVVRGKDGLTLELALDRGLLRDGRTKYPVWVDPAFTTTSAFDTTVTDGVTVDQSSASTLAVGWTAGVEARAFQRWSTAGLAGRHVASAVLNIREDYNASCQSLAMELWRTGSVSTATRWTSQPGWIQLVGTGATEQTSLCKGWRTIDATSAFQAAADNNWTEVTTGLRSTMTRRTFQSNDGVAPPYVTVTYDEFPGAPYSAELAPCVTACASPAVTASDRPTLAARIPNPERAGLRVAFEVWSSDKTVRVDDSDLAVAGVLSGMTATWKTAASLTNGTTYHWRSRTVDGTANSPWSEWFTFTVDTSSPSSPSVTSTSFPSSGWALGAGQTGNILIDPPDTDTTAAVWHLDDGVETVHPTTGSAFNASVTPTTNGRHTFTAWTRDRAGNESSRVTYVFFVGPGAITTPTPGDRIWRDTPLAAEAPSSATGVTFSYRYSPSAPWTIVPAAHVKDGAATITWPVPLTSGVSPTLTWTATSTVATDARVEIRAEFHSASGSTYSAPTSVAVDRDGSGAARQQVGPGEVNLASGAYEIFASDQALFGLTVHRATSSRPVAASWYGTYNVIPMFGPAWHFGGLNSDTPATHLAVKPGAGNDLNVVGPGGSAQTLVRSGSGAPWTGPDAFGGTLSVTLTGSSYTMTDSRGYVTVFSPVTGVAGAFVSSLTGALPSDPAFGYRWEAAGTQARLKYVASPTPAVPTSTCLTTPATSGCRVLEFVYASSTTATGTTIGSYAGRVSALRLWVNNPGAAAATATTVATYGYDSQGLLREAWDPRVTPSLKMQYAYDSAGRVSTLTKPGELPWTFTYGQVGAGPLAAPGMLLSVSRSTLVPGSKTVTNGTATMKVVYEVPLTGSAAPHAMGATDVATWRQADLPREGTAVFPADQVPTANVGSALSGTSYTRAFCYYLGEHGQVVNEASPGGHISTTEYSSTGRVSRELSASNRALALGSDPESVSRILWLGLSGRSGADRAFALSTVTLSNADGSRETEVYGPQQRAAVNAVIPGTGTTSTIPADATIVGRPHTSHLFDEGRPSSAPAKNLATRTTAAVKMLSNGAHVEARVTTVTFDWALGKPTQVVQDPDGLAITSAASYNSSGQILQRTPDGASAGSASTEVTTYYTAGGVAPCGGRPEWAGLVCRTAPAALVTGPGGPSVELPTSTITYERHGQPAVVTLTANGATRTTTYSYDPAGRRTGKHLTGGPGTALSAATLEYDSTNGSLFRTVTSDRGVLRQEFDTLGRFVRYVDSSSGETLHQYDALDRRTQTQHVGVGTLAFTYDTNLDKRGVLTSMADSVAGTTGFSYDADGRLVQETLPGGVTMTQRLGTDGEANARTYRKSGVTEPLLTAETRTLVGTEPADRSSGIFQRGQRFDGGGRLALRFDTSSTGAQRVCKRTSYSYNAAGNRTGEAVATGAPGAPCPAANGTSVAHTYDSAGRIVDAGYSYDAHGRLTSTPGGISNSYYVDDSVNVQTKAADRQTWAIDPAFRQRTATVDKLIGGSWTLQDTLTLHYSSSEDPTAWVTHSGGSVDRSLNGSAGISVGTVEVKGSAVTVVMEDLRGGAALELAVGTGQITVLDLDDYGVPRSGGTFPMVGIQILSPELDLVTRPTVGRAIDVQFGPDNGTPTCTIRSCIDIYLFKTPLKSFTAMRVSSSRDSRLVWSADGCSSPLKGTGYGFTPSCNRHDFGYRNYRKFVSGRNENDRGKIDNRFRSDLDSRCQELSVLKGRADCMVWKDTYYYAVRNFGRSSFY